MAEFTSWYPDLTKLTLAQRAKFEFNRDYAAVISDVTSYDHSFLREFLGSHWKTAMLSGALGEPKISEEEAFAALDTHNTLRETAVSQAEPESRRIYLWPRGKVPAVTKYTANPDYEYADMPDFEPYMLEMIIPEDIPAKGALILCAGGAHRFRSNIEETYEVALEFNKLGYQCFIVNYRVNPYTDEESALDIGRAVRYVRANAKKYRIREDRIAAAGFSWGGIVVSLQADRFGGAVNAQVLTAEYEPDELDRISADINANFCIYSAVPEKLHNDHYPPTFLCWGLEDELIQQMAGRSYSALRQKGVKTEIHTFAGVPHAFGAGTDAGGRYYKTAAQWISFADAFMDDVFQTEKRQLVCTINI